jgi:hypothetical protein
MKWMWFLLLSAPVGGCSGPAGDGDVVSCSCELSYVGGPQTTYVEGTIAISLCETTFATDHSADAEAECVTLSDTSDTGQAAHQCACTCVHLTERCDTQ